MTSETIYKTLSSVRLPLENEKVLQEHIARVLSSSKINFLREHRLDSRNIIDFLVSGIGIEVKISGGKKSIYNQCVRYCDFESVKELILITNKSMGFPSEINNKPCFVLNLGKAWL